MDRTELLLADGWRFLRGDAEPAWQKNYDDTSWETVTLPHDWSVTAPFRKENSSGTGYLDGGIAWYRGRFSLPKKYQGKSVRLVFDGVYKNAKVFCNSYYLGRRPFGYAEFSFDITGFVHFGQQDNEISVRVSHPDIADSRWFTGSGIYRKVRLVIEEPVHPAEHSIVFSASDITEQQAVLTVSHEIENTTCADKQIEIRTQFNDRQTGAIVLELTGSAAVPANGAARTLMKGTILDPKLWSPDAPHLYEMTSTYTAEGLSYVADQQTVGIRKLYFDADKGFFLNDTPMKLKGVCIHHDAGSLGAAVPREVLQRRLEGLKEMGCNAIRTSHNPHAPELYELCDAMGFLVMDEAFDEWEGCKNKWSTGHNVYPPRHQGYYEDFPEWHDKDLRMMVRRDRNHPSVVMWSIGNEIDYPNDPYCHPRFTEMTGNNDANKPAAERQYNPDKPNMERIVTLAEELVRIVKEEDATRPVTVAAAFPELSTYLGFVDHVDVIGYNYKEQFYEADHKRFPDRPLLGTENGHRPEAWQIVEDLDYVCGQFLWTGIDYLGEAHGWPIHGSGAGFLTTAGLKKESFYKRQALWTGSTKVPVVTDAPAVQAEVQLYKKGDFVSGESFRKASARKDYMYQLIITLKDAKGHMTTDVQKIRCQVLGNGAFVSMDNGDLADLTPLTSAEKQTYRGQIVVYVRRTGKGKIHVRLSAEDPKILDTTVSI